MTTLCGPMKEKLSQTTVEISSWFVFKQSNEVLRHCLQSAPRNATYTSKTIQNELVHIIGSSIRSDIREIKQAKFYTVLDEVSNVSNKEQLLPYTMSSMALFMNHESFIDFAEVERITGEALASTILHCVQACMASAMIISGAVAGCKSLQEAPMSVFSLCCPQAESCSYFCLQCPGF